MNGVLLHPGLEALVEPAKPALVPPVLVHCAVPVVSAGVAGILPHAPPEEPLAAVTRQGAVVLPRDFVPANGALRPAAGAQGGRRLDAAAATTVVTRMVLLLRELVVLVLQVVIGR